MKTLFAVLFASAFLAGCVAIPQYGTTTTTTVEKTATGGETKITTTVVRERPAPPPSTTVYVPVPAYSAYPVYPVYPVVPMYYGPAWSVCINCRRGHWRW